MEAILERIRHDVRLARSPARESVDPEELVRDAVARYRDLARLWRKESVLSAEATPLARSTPYLVPAAALAIGAENEFPVTSA